MELSYISQTKIPHLTFNYEQLRKGLINSHQTMPPAILERGRSQARLSNTIVKATLSHLNGCQLRHGLTMDHFLKTKALTAEFPVLA